MYLAENFYQTLQLSIIKMNEVYNIKIIIVGNFHTTPQSLTDQEDKLIN